MDTNGNSCASNFVQYPDGIKFRWGDGVIGTVSIDLRLIKRCDKHTALYVPSNPVIGCPYCRVDELLLANTVITQRNQELERCSEITTHTNTELSRSNYEMRSKLMKIEETIKGVTLG